MVNGNDDALPPLSPYRLGATVRVQVVNGKELYEVRLAEARTVHLSFATYWYHPCSKPRVALFALEHQHVPLLLVWPGQVERISLERQHVARSHLVRARNAL